MVAILPLLVLITVRKTCVAAIVEALFAAVLLPAALHAQTAAGGTFTPALPTASVTLTIAGVAYVASLPASVSADRWMSGALAYEARSVIAPSSGGAHPFLRVIFDTRVY